MTRSRRWVLVMAAAMIVVVGLVLAYAALPGLVRRVTIARIQALTGRPTAIESVTLHLLRGGVDVHGLRVTERDGSPLADVQELSLRVRLPALLFGHIHVRELVLRAPSVRVVRLSSDEFNISDMVRSSGKTESHRDVTVDHFVLDGGTVTLEDRALPEARTWRSEQIAIEAHNVSTRRDDGTAVGRSITAGAPVSVRLEQLRLYPVHLRAHVTVEGLDVSLAQLYVPSSVPVVVERGRATTRVDVALDARNGMQVDATTQLEDLAVARRGDAGTGVMSPRMTVTLAGLTANNGAFALRQLDVTAATAVLDRRLGPSGRVDFPDMQAHLADVSWPVSSTARIDVRSGPSRAGTFSLGGVLRPAPAPSELALRAAGFDLAPWAVLLPVAARVSGVAEADLQVNEPLAADVPTRVRGTVAVRRPAVADGARTLLAADRIAATGLELRWPSRVAVGRLSIEGPRAIVERDREGKFPLMNLVSRPTTSTPDSAGRNVRAQADNGRAPAPTNVLGVDVGTVVVRGGTLDWHDDAIKPAARLRLTGVEASVTGVAWPLQGPAAVRLALRTPGNGDLRFNGRVNLDPMRGEGHLTARGVELAPYRPYVPMPTLIEGRVDLDVDTVVARTGDGEMTARGTAGVARLNVQDGERTIARVGEATARGLEVDWPRRVAVDHLVLRQPWLLFERDERGQFLLPLLLRSRPTTTAPATTESPSATPDATAASTAEPLDVKVARVTMENGGARIVDRSVSPAFAADMDSLALRGNGFSTTPAPPARVDLTARLTSGADVSLRGTVGPLMDPLRVDLSGELRRFDIPRANTYLTRQVGWQAREGWLATTVRLRLDGDALDARTDFRLSRLALTRSRDTDEAQARIGLPLGMLVSLMKDRHGDITMAFPVGGRLSDPRFELSEAIWKAARRVAVNAVTLPVSWIGRVHVSADSRIENIEIEPIRFEPGADTLTQGGVTQLTHVAAFLEQLPDARLTATPVVTSRDAIALKQRALDAAVEQTAKAGGLSSAQALARLYAERFPKAPSPSSDEAMRAALLEQQPVPTSELTDLATRRVQQMRAQGKRLGLDADRLPTLEPEVRTEAPFTGVELALAAPPDGTKPSGLMDRLRELGRSIGKPSSSR